MAAGEIHVGDVGTSLRATIYSSVGVVKDVSAASSIQLIFMKPDRSIATFDADLYTDGTDGVVEYITDSADDLDQAGVWNLQGKVIISAAPHKSDVTDFRVYPNLN